MFKFLSLLILTTACLTAQAQRSGGFSGSSSGSSFGSGSSSFGGSDANPGRGSSGGSNSSSWGGGSSGGSGSSWGGSSWNNGSIWSSGSSSSGSNTWVSSSHYVPYSRPLKRPDDVRALVNLEQTWLGQYDKTMSSASPSASPFQGVNVETIRFTVDAQKGGRFTLSTGAVIEIPQNAFMDNVGNVIQGTVDMEYREFHDAADIIASGIAMHDAATGQFMETAGMFDLNAKQGDRALFLRYEKFVRVEMPSYNSGNDFDFWRYNNRNNQWGETDGPGQPRAQTIGRRRAEAIARNNNRTELPIAVRSFSIGALGLHNWDRLTSLTRENTRSQVDFLFDSHVPTATDWNAIPFYFITRNGRSVVSLTYEEARTVNFTPYSSEVLVAVFPGNRVATFNGTDFGKIDRSAPRLTYAFRTAAQPVSSLAEFAQALRINR